MWARIVEPSRPRRHQSGYMRLGDNKSEDTSGNTRQARQDKRRKVWRHNSCHMAAGEQKDSQDV